MERNQLLKLKNQNEQLAWSQMVDGTPVNLAMPVRVTIETTLKCNMRCKMCQVHRNPEVRRKANVVNSDMSIDLFRRIVREIFPTVKMACPTVMGEPFLTSFFPEFVQQVTNYGVKMNIVTNGMLLTKHISESIMPHLFNLTISFEGANRKTFEAIRVGASFERIVDNVINFDRVRRKFLRDERPTLTLQVTLMRQNIEELPEIVEMASDMGVDKIVAFHMFAFDKRLQRSSLLNYQELTDDYLRYAKELGERLNIQLTLPSPFKSRWDMCGFDSNAMSEVTNGRRCKFLWSEVWISHNGDVTPCCVPNRPVMGSLNEDSFGEIWNGELYERIRKGLVEGEPFECCRYCAFASQYRGEREYDERSLFLECQT